jgi:hypothetical protein
MVGKLAFNDYAQSAHLKEHVRHDISRAANVNRLGISRNAKF